MDLEQIKLFVQIVNQNTLSQAAETMHITQSAASQSLSKLESELGCRLFTRHKRGLVMCPEGEAFFKRAVRILNELELATIEVTSKMESISGKLRLRVLAASALMPKLIYDFHNDYPDVKISMTQQHQSEDYDVCITTGEFDPMPAGARPLYTEEIMLAVPANNRRYFDKESISLKELSDEQFLLTRTGSSLRTIANRLFRHCGLEPTILFEGDNPSIVRELITMGLGVTFLPRVSWQNIVDQGIRLLHISDCECKRVVYIYAPANKVITKTIMVFQDYAGKYFEKMQNLEWNQDNM